MVLVVLIDAWCHSMMSTWYLEVTGLKGSSFRERESGCFDHSQSFTTIHVPPNCVQQPTTLWRREHTQEGPWGEEDRNPTRTTTAAPVAHDTPAVQLAGQIC